MLKKSMILVAVLAMAVSSVQATNLFTTGDMESGGNATTPPLTWTTRPEMTSGVSSDTPSGTGQSLSVLNNVGTPGTTYYISETSSSGTWTGTEKLLVAFDAKGDIYTGGTAGLGIWAQTSGWLHYSKWMTPAAGVHGFDMKVYNNSLGGSAGASAAYMDNLYIGDDYTYQDFGPNNKVYNGDVDTHSDGAYWWGPSIAVSNDTAVPGGTYSIDLGVDNYVNLASRDLVENTQYEVTFWHKGTFDYWFNETDAVAVRTIAGSSDWMKTSFIVTTDAGAGTGPYMYFSDSITGGDSVLIDNVTLVEVPEPMTMTLIALGGLALIRRRK